MKIKDYLKEYLNLNKEIDSMVSESSRLRKLAESIGQSLGNSNGGGGGKHASAGAAKFENAIDKIVTLEGEINKKIDVLIQQRIEIEAAINSVEETILRTLLRYRYINGYTFERVAVEIGYSWRQTIRLHGDALRKVVIECHIVS